MLRISALNSSYLLLPPSKLSEQPPPPPYSVYSICPACCANLTHQPLPPSRCSPPQSAKYSRPFVTIRFIPLSHHHRASFASSSFEVGRLLNKIMQIVKIYFSFQNIISFSFTLHFKHLFNLTERKKYIILRARALL